MPNNKRPDRTETWRKNISRSMLVNRLIDNALGKIQLTALQVKSIEILLKKTIPDLKSIEHSGEIKGTYETTLREVLKAKETNGS